MTKPLSEMLAEVEPKITGTAPIDEGRNAVEIVDAESYAKLKQIALILSEAYDLMRDAACTGLDCNCTASQRLSGHRSTCQVPQIEFEINKADEALTKCREMLGAK